MDQFDPERYLDAAAAVLRLTVAPEHRAGVLLNLERLAAMAALVEAHPFDAEVEQAPVFRP